MHRYSGSTDGRACATLRGACALLVLPLILSAAGPGASGYVPRPAPRFQERSRVEKSIAAGRGDTIVIRNEFGDVRVTAGAGSTVKVEAQLIAGGDTRVAAGDCLRKLTVGIERSGRRVSITTPELHDNCGATQFQVNLEVVMPEDCVLEVENAYGDVNITGLRAPTRVANRFGSTSVERGGSTDITNSFGNVSAVWLTAGATIQNRFGNVSVHDLTGPVTVTNENGMIRLLRTRGAMRLENIGDVTLTDCRGHIQVTGSDGSIDFEQVEPGADTVALTSRSGEIHLKLPAAASARISARTPNGKVETAHPAGPDGTWQFGTGLTIFDLETAGARILIDAHE